MKDRSKHSERIDKEDFERLKKPVLLFIKTVFIKSGAVWRSCYSCKQRITSRLGYFYEMDMLEYFQLAGFPTRLDLNGKPFVKCGYRSASRVPKKYGGLKPDLTLDEITEKSTPL